MSWSLLIPSLWGLLWFTQGLSVIHHEVKKTKPEQMGFVRFAVLTCAAIMTGMGFMMYYWILSMFVPS